MLKRLTIIIYIYFRISACIIFFSFFLFPVTFPSLKLILHTLLIIFIILCSNDGKVENDEEMLGSLMMDSSEAGTDTKDTVAEPIFSFLEELCELRGAGKWLRKTLISFVQITYGKTITR